MNQENKGSSQFVVRGCITGHKAVQVSTGACPSSGLYPFKDVGGIEQKG